MPVTYLSNCDAPTGLTSGSGGDTSGGGSSTIVTSTSKGVVGVNIIGAAPGSIPAITMPSSVQVGNHLIALCISYTAVPVVNTGGGWNNVSAVSHTPSILDPAVAMAWKYFPAGGPQVETPFSAGGATDSLMAVWEVHGLDPTFTPNLHSTAFVSPNFGGSNVDLSDSTPAAGLYLFLAGQLPNSGDPGTGTLGFAGWTTDGTTHANGYGGVCAHIGYSSTPVGTVEQALSFGGGASIAGILVGLAMSGVDTAGVSTTTGGYQSGVSTSGGTAGEVAYFATSTSLSGLTFSGDATLNTGTGALTIANDAVSYAKMQNVSAASRLLGRGSSGAGDPQEITLGSGLSISGTTLSATGSGGTLTTTGSPAAGNLATFSSSTSLTNGNLSGDVTTSGTLATTLAASGVTAGFYTNADITVDAKGRVTAASNGTGGVGSMDKARAYMNAAANTTTAGWQKVPIDTIDFDTNSIWDSTNKRFVPKQAGKYHVNVRCRAATTVFSAAAIGKNGAQSQGVGDSVVATLLGISGGAIIDCNGTTDAIDFWVFAASVVAYTTGSFETWVDIHGPL